MVNTEQRAFPLELLEKSSEAKTAYFKSIIIPHRNLQEALNRLLINLLEPADTLVFLVFGVTGVGKTTLRLRLEKLLLEHFLPELQANPGQIAVASVEAIPAERGNFSYKDYYLRALESLKEILREYKLNYHIPSQDNHDFGLINPTHHRDAPALRRAMEKVFRYRQLKSFMVDEAQHLLMMSGGQQMLHQMNWLKSMANLTGTVHVLWGTYELLNCSTLSGQVGRRSEDIHLTPYEADKTEDISEFIKVIRTLQTHLPLKEEPLLENHYEYLFDGSVGCIGILKNWLTRSLRFAIAEHSATLTLKHLEQGAFSPSRINQIFQEAQQGKSRMAQESSFSPKPSLTISSSSSLDTGSHSRKGRVGQRKPKRDPVGVKEHQS